MTDSIIGRSGVARAAASSWNYDMKECPRGAKVLLLTQSGIGIIGHVSDSVVGYIAWAPMPDRDRTKEAEIAASRGLPYL